MKSIIASSAIAAVLATGIVADARADEAAKNLAAENYMQADANGDSALTLAEFTTLINLNAEDGLGKAHMIKRMGRYSMAFGRIDANSDGLVTPEEMQAMAARAGR